MAAYYIDIGLGTGLGTKSGVDPANCMGWDAIQSYLYNDTDQSGDTWYLKGLRQAESNFKLNNIIIDKWSTETAPWIFYNLNTGSFIARSVTACTVKNGIIQRNKTEADPGYGTTAISNSLFYNVFLQTISSANNLSISGSSFYGSTVIANCVRSGYTGNVDLNSSANVFQDCVIDFFSATGVVNHASTSFTKCCVTFDGTIGTQTDCQTGWTPPTWPAYNDATESSYSYSVLGTTINTQVGTPPYTGYPKGLWDTSRDRIGSFDFPPFQVSCFNVGSVADGTSVMSTVNRSYLVTSIQAAGADTYFDSTSKISRVDVVYVHQDGRQNTRIIHRAPSFSTSTQWKAGDTLDGTWAKRLVKSFDWDGAENSLNSPAGENLTHSSGTMTLNT